MRGKWKREDVFVAVVASSASMRGKRVVNVGWEVFWDIRGVERRDFVIVNTSEVLLWRGCAFIKKRKVRRMCKVCGGHCS